MAPAADGDVDLRVRRCTVRVRRRGGWSWGDPGRYADLVLPAIEAALRGLVEDAGLPPGVDCHLTGPVVLELTADGRPTPASRAALLDALRSATAAATRELRSAAERPLEHTPHDGPVPDAVDAAADETARELLARALAAWSRSGRLAALAASWSPVVLAAWEATVRSLVATHGSDEPVLEAAAVTAIAEAVLGAEPDGRPPSEDRARAAADLVVLLGAVVVAAGDRWPAAETLDLVLRRTVGTAHAAGPETVDVVASPVVAAPRVAASSPPSAAVTAPAIVPGLPFLVLVQLARIGYLEPAAAALVAAGVPAPALAAAVAGKALPAPDRGWRRRPSEREAVLLAAGVDGDRADEALVALTAARELVEPVWRTALVELYRAGRERGDEVVVTELGEERVCGEAAGLLPLAWVPADGVGAVLHQLGDPPARTDALLAPVAEALGPRRGLPGLAAPDLERQLAAVLGTALGSLAVELWGPHADCLTALERLDDLEVRVVPGARLEVGVPRGRRWLDLGRAGLLDTWSVPGHGVWELVSW